MYGKINSLNYSFDIKYILDFYSNHRLEIELSYLMTNGIEKYIKNKTFLNENDDINIISPIFENDNDIIGNCCKYYSNKQNYNYNYNKSNFKNENLVKAIEFYFNYREFSKKIKEAKSDEKEYCLIRSNIMSEIKINYKYKQIKKILDKINFIIDNKYKKFLAIENLSNDIINFFDFL